MLLDDQPLAEGRVHVTLPPIERLKNVTVGIDDVVDTSHWGLRRERVNNYHNW
jgi:hypothetical protein